MDVFWTVSVEVDSTVRNSAIHTGALVQTHSEPVLFPGTSICRIQTQSEAVLEHFPTVTNLDLVIPLRISLKIHPKIQKYVYGIRFVLPAGVPATIPLGG